MASAIPMTVRLLISQEALALPRLGLALSSSVLLHGAIAAAIWSYSGLSRNGIGQIPSQYRVQIVHLVRTQQPVLIWPNTSIQSHPAAKHTLPDRANRKPAPETLLVGGAPPESQLRQAVPLPAAAAWSGFNIVSSAADQVAIRELNEPRALDAPDPAFLPIPRIDILSVPEIALPDAAVPVVSQETASSWSIAAIASQSSETAASSSLIGAPGSTLESTPDPTLTRIELPPYSRPPVSLLGESVAGQYPEIAKIPARVVSTIYLRMGLKKSWSLEYWTAQPDQKGGITGLDAPWPYLMLRPKLEVFIRRECRSRTWRSDHRRPAAGTLAGAPASVVPEGSFIRSARELEVPTSFTEWATATRGSSACYPAPAGRINYWTRATWRTGNIAAELRFIVILEVPPRLSMSTMISPSTFVVPPEFPWSESS